MEEITPREIQINVNELVGEPVNLNLAEVQETEVEFEEQVIDAPSQYSLDGTTVQGILEGFTEGATKNILTLSTDKVRLYEVTQDKIKLLSCSILPQKLTKLNPNANFLQLDSYSVQVFDCLKQSNHSIILKFDLKSGSLVDLKEIEVWEGRNVSGIQRPEIVRPKSTKIGWFVTFRIQTNPGEFHGQTHFEIGRQRGRRLLGWMHFDRIFQKKLVEVNKRYQEKLFGLREAVRANFRFNDYFEHRFYRYSIENPDLTLAVSASRKGYIFWILNIRKKKVIKSTSFTILDIWDQKSIEDLLLDTLQRDPAEEAEGLINIPDNEFVPPTFQNFREYAYFPKSGSFFAVAKIKNLEIILKLSDLFSSNSLKNIKMNKRRGAQSSITKLMSFGEDRLLSLYSGQVRSTYLRPLAFINLDNLQETKIQGFDEAGRSKLLFSMYGLQKKNFVKINSKRMLVMNKHLIFIYDFELDKPIAQQIYCFQRTNWKRFIKIDNLHVATECKYLHILRTKMSSEGNEVIEKQKIIHFNDFIPNLSVSSGMFGFNFFRLNSGNYLYISTKYVDLINERRFRVFHLMTMEIESKTMEVVSCNVFLPERFESTIYPQYVHLVNDFLVFTCKIRRPQNENQQEPNFDADSYSLILSSTDFIVLDHCSQSNHRRYGSITAVSSNRIASFGPQNSVYLHGIDFGEKKLSLLKTIVLGSVEIQRNNISGVCSSSFCFLTKDTSEGEQENNQERTLLIFDTNLNLLQHLKLLEARDVCFVYPLKQEKVVFFEGQINEGGSLYVIDMKTKDVQLARKNIAGDRPLNYVVENGTEERFINIEFAIGGDRIAKVILK